MILCRAALLVLGLALLAAPPGRAKERENKLPAKVLAVLEKADKLELLSLQPDDIKRVKGGFHGWEVLGRTEVKDAKVRKQLVDALKKGVQESDGNGAKCVVPR